MRPDISRLLSVALVLVALLVGLVIGRVIEAIAVAAVLYAGSTYVRRLASPAGPSSRSWDETR